jgi:hypothetical protein
LLGATSAPGFGEEVVAFMNPGGIRDDLIFAEALGGEVDVDALVSYFGANSPGPQDRITRLN